MFKELIIKDFRQFKDVDIVLGKQLTILAGRNSTGKSTVLGLLGNSCELKKKDGLTITKKRFKAEFSEILHGSKQFDSSGSDRLQINVADDEGNIVDYRQFRTSWQKDKGKDRFRVIPLKTLENGKKTEAKMQIPVLYLGLSRLYPIGEIDEDDITSKKIVFDDDGQKKWFVEKYASILSMYEDIKSVENYQLNGVSKKNGVGVETASYDYLTNSAGQDNLGQILLAMLSFGRLRSQLDKWNGGLLLIDEVDATLHPAAQKRLIDLLIKESKKNNYQVVVTTHSTDLLKYVCEKIAHNSLINNSIEVFYFTNGNRILEIKRNISFSSIDNDLHVESMVQSSSRIKIYSEDAENRWFLKKLVPEYMPYVDLLDVKIGCDQLISLYMGDLPYFKNVLLVFDGDVKEERLNQISPIIRDRLNNIIKLPGEVRPEEVFYNYLVNLGPEHPYWNSSNDYVNWTYFMDNGPNSQRYSQEKERERYKQWFKDHEQVFEVTKLFDYWAQDNEELIRLFKDSFIKSYNAIAIRTLAPKISI